MVDVTPMLRQFLSSLGGKSSVPTSAPAPARAEAVEEAPVAMPPAKRPRSIRRYPRSVCTTLKDLCEL
jgi:hypothetical protein